MGKPLCFSPKNSPPVAQPIFNIVFCGLVFEDSKEMLWGVISMGGVVSNQFKPTANWTVLSRNTIYF